MHAVSALDALFDQATACVQCSAPIPRAEGRGRPRSFCVGCRPDQKTKTLLLAVRNCADCRGFLGLKMPGERGLRCKDCNRRRVNDASRLLRDSRRPPGARPVSRLGWCLECFSTLTGIRRRYCSQKCRDALEVRAISREYARRRPPATERRCAECTSAFTSDHRTRIFCGRTCLKRHADRIKSSQRRARQIGAEDVNPLVVFERDGWRCQMCRRKTPRKLRGKHLPLSPELDHIVPLAAGGEHTYRNTQCLCHECNAKKGTQVIGQMRLFG